MINSKLFKLISKVQLFSAVALAFADLLDVDEQTLSKIMLPFGGGLGRQRLTCGAVSGMCAVAGLLFAESDNTFYEEPKICVYDKCPCWVAMITNEEENWLFHWKTPKVRPFLNK